MQTWGARARHNEHMAGAGTGHRGRSHSTRGGGHAAQGAWWRDPRTLSFLSVGVGVVVLGASWLTGFGGGQEAAAPPSASASVPAALPSVEHSVEGPEDSFVTVVATVSSEELPVYTNPGDGVPSQTLPRWSNYAQPLSLVSEDVTEVEGERWHFVTLPIQPNGTTGWIREQDVTLSTVTAEIYVILDEHRVVYLEEGVEVLSVEAVIGASASPTPTGTFYVTDLLPLANDSGVYGAGALGLSGYSETLEEFNGGLPQLAIHGTNATHLLGQSVSNGCVRVTNDQILGLLDTVHRGTPVHIHDTRPDVLAG